MKKTVLLFAGLLLLYCSAFAQKFFVEPRLGSNVIPMEKSDLGYDYRLGVHTGIGLEYHLSNRFSLHSGLFFDQKKKFYHSADTSDIMDNMSGMAGLFGIDQSFIDSLIGVAGVDQNVYSKTDGIVTLNYLELPLLATYKMGDASIYFGPYVSVLLGARSKETTISHSPLMQAIDISQFDTTGMLSLFLPPPESQTFTESSSAKIYSAFDFGAVAGIGYCMKNLNVNAYFKYGFLDYRKAQDDSERQVHKAVCLSVAYRFGLNFVKKNKPMYHPGA